jgi:3-oxoacyl-[acyl-carrier protein] reductase
VSEPFAFVSDLAGRRAVVTGGAHGIGLAVARWLLVAGASVAVIDREFRAQEQDLAGEGFELVSADLGAGDPVSLAEELLATGPVELIVNNVGISTEHSFTELDIAGYDRVMAVNLRGPWFMTRRLVQELIATERRGSVLFMSSLHDHVVFRHPHYSASKAGIAMLTREMAHELGPHGIRVNAISPGSIATWGLTKKQRERGHDKIPLGRHGEADDIAPVAVALLSDSICGYVTGANVPVDGGLDLHNWVDP